MLRKIYPELNQALGGATTDAALDAAARLRVIATSNAFLRVFLDSWLLLGFAVFGYAWFRTPEALYFPISLLVTGAVARLALHRGRPVLARSLLIVPMALLIAIAPALLNGIRTPILANVPLLLMLAGWMLGRRIMLWIAALYALELVLLWQLEAQGLWTMSIPLRSPDVWLMVWLFDFAFTAVILGALIGNYQADFRHEGELQRRIAVVLRNSEAILENSPLPMRVFDSTGQCTRVNEAWAKLAGIPREVLLLHTLDELSTGPHANLVHDFRAAIDTMQPLRRELHSKTEDGRETWVELHALPFEEAGGRSLLLQLVDLSERKRLAAELEQLAFHDPLTRLPNRRLFLDRLEHALRSCRRHDTWGGVLLLDLNRFKELNDTHGHEAGDRLLIDVAERMRATVRGSDTPARLGGDEFVVLAGDLGHTREIAEQNLLVLQRKLETVLSAPYELGPVRHEGSASIGSTLFGATSAPEPEVVVRLADEAMYAAKKRSRTAT